ncbi:MAG: HDOD domain-containing protein [Kangiellaceae bacterium]|nr:HDOD domain-containing protein [Kangiellaceae bacterium]
MGRQQVPLRLLAPVLTLQESNPELFKELVEQFNLTDLTEDQSKSIDIGLYQSIISWFYTKTQNRSLGFSIGLTSAMNATGPIGVYISGCETLLKAFNQLQVYYPLVKIDDSELNIKPHEKGAIIEISNFSFDNIAEVYIKDTMLGRMIRVGNRVAGPEFYPELIGYPQSEFGLPENIEQFTKKVVATKDKLFLFFSDEVLNKPSLYSNTEILKLLKPKLDEELENLRRIDSILIQIREYLATLTTLKDVTQASIAENFNMSLSSLRRRFAESETSFSEFFQRYRRNRSLEMLAEEETKLEVIAEVLGFSERASFDRAFRQWFDTTPAKYREQILNLGGKDIKVNHLDVNKLPASPKSCTQILELMNKENYNIDELVQLVSLDPLLSAKVMSISRSAFYGARNVRSLSDAITKVLGVDQVRYLALMTASNSSFGKNLPENFNLEHYWQTSLLTAIFLSKLHRVSNRKFTTLESEVYLVGLFFNIGAFMLASMFPNRTQQFLESLDKKASPSFKREKEKEIFGTTIYSAGALLIAHWDLPKAVFKVVKELDELAGSSKLSNEASLTKLISRFVYFYFPDMQDDEMKQRFIDDVSRCLDIGRENVELILTKQCESIEDLRAMIKELTR